MTLESFASILFWPATAANAVMLLGTAGNVFSAPRLEGRSGVPGASALPGRPKVSLLIPARDEETNLAVLLPLLKGIDYPHLEILILDDQSSDGTARLAASGPARLIQGSPPPEGWLGKNWACSQLAGHARGDILIFCDADVRIGPGAVAATVAMMESRGLDALTCLPRQILGTWSEKAVIPILLFMPLLGFLPLALVSRLSHPALSLGCGQWFAFRRNAYVRLGGHAPVRREIVEDMVLGRLVKQAGMKLGALISTRHLATRMYGDFPSLWRGFGKNLAFLTGTGWLKPACLSAGFLLIHVLPWSLSLAGFTYWLLPLGLWMGSRLLAAAAFREPPAGWLWSAAGTLLIPAIAARSWWGYRRRSVRWKGRRLDAAFGTAAGYGTGSGPAMARSAGKIAEGKL